MGKIMAGAGGSKGAERRKKRAANKAARTAKREKRVEERHGLKAGEGKQFLKNRSDRFDAFANRLNERAGYAAGGPTKGPDKYAGTSKFQGADELKATTDAEGLQDKANNVAKSYGDASTGGGVSLGITTPDQTSSFGSNVKDSDLRGPRNFLSGGIFSKFL